MKSYVVKNSEGLYVTKACRYDQALEFSHCHNRAGYFYKQIADDIVAMSKEDLYVEEVEGSLVRS